MVKLKNVEAIQEMLAKAIGAAGEEETDPEAAEKFIRACRELCKFCHIPTLEEYGIDREAFLEKIPKMTRDALASGSLANTRKEFLKKILLRYTNRCWFIH